MLLMQGLLPLGTQRPSKLREDQQDIVGYVAIMRPKRLLLKLNMCVLHHIFKLRRRRRRSSSPEQARRQLGGQWLGRFEPSLELERGFYEATRLENLLGPDHIETRRKELESKGPKSSSTSSQKQ